MGPGIVSGLGLRGFSLVDEARILPMIIPARHTHIIAEAVAAYKSLFRVRALVCRCCSGLSA